MKIPPLFSCFIAVVFCFYVRYVTSAAFLLSSLRPSFLSPLPVVISSLATAIRSI